MKLFFFYTAVAALSLSGCALLPYDSHYLCEKTDDYGHCTSVQGAYNDAVNSAPNEGDGAGHESKVGHHSDKDESNKDEKGTDVHAPSDPSVTAHNTYQDAQYRALAGLIDQPVSPVVAPAKVLRTLIVSYEDHEALYMPRYVFFVVDNPHFVLGDYLNNEVPAGPSIFPNGHSRTSPESH